MSRAAWACLTIIVVVVVSATVIILVPFVYGTAPRSTPSSSFLSGEVSVGSASDQPGLGFLNPGANRTDGFDADFTRWLGDNSTPRWTPVFAPVSVNDRVKVLKDGERKLVIQSFSITDERLATIDMAGPYLINFQGVLVRRGDARFPTPDSLKDKNVCAPAGSTSIIELQKRGVLVTADAGIVQCVERLHRGEVDAVSTDQLLLYGYARRFPDLYSVVQGNTFGLREEYGVGLPYGSFDECVQITHEIERFVDSPAWGEYLRGNFGEIETTPYRPTRLNSCIRR
jgi:glutamate transport system substrate-binding protein